jgi:hypothetical protein
MIAGLPEAAIACASPIRCASPFPSAIALGVSVRPRPLGVKREMRSLAELVQEELVLGSPAAPLIPARKTSPDSVCWPVKRSKRAVLPYAPAETAAWAVTGSKPTATRAHAARRIRTTGEQYKPRWATTSRSHCSACSSRSRSPSGLSSAQSPQLLQPGDYGASRELRPLVLGRAIEDRSVESRLLGGLLNRCIGRRRRLAHLAYL